MPDAADAPVELDPLPSDEELQAIDVSDVELSEFDAGTAAPDADSIEAEADAESLDVGDLLGEDELQETPSPDIRMFRGEESFQPDEDSLRLQPDPATGELTFPVSTSDEEEADVLYDPTDDADVLDEPTDADVLAGPDEVSDDVSADDDLPLEATVEFEEIEFDKISDDEINDAESPDHRDESGDRSL
jgi:hypothetical protein